MTALALTITNAGRAAIVNATNTGTGPVVLSQVALGSATYAAPSAAQTALVAEIKRISSFGADVVADDTIHVTITDTSPDTYTLGEIGLYTNAGVLFAVYSQATQILEKGAHQLVLLSADILLTSVPPGSVTIGDTDFMLPPASTVLQGVIELATDAEVDAGTDAERAVTPAGLKRCIDTRAPATRNIVAGNGLSGGGNLTADRTLALGLPGTLSGSTTNAVSTTSHTHSISSATDTLSGVVELATAAETQAGTDTARAVTPAGVAAAIANKANVSGNYPGLTAGYAGNADTVDGYHASQLWRSDMAASSFGLAGYQKLPSGRIEQWGPIAAGATNITFPIAFPTACTFAVASGSSTNVVSIVLSKTTTGFSINGTTASGTWYAIGY